MTTRTQCEPVSGTVGCTETGTTILEKGGFLWDGDTLLAEVGLNLNGEPIWRKHYLPGPTGLDDTPLVRVERDLLTSEPSEGVYAYIRDELGSVIGLAEVRQTLPEEAEPVLERWFYTPFGEAHIERGPELLSLRLDPAVTTVGGEDQAEPVPEQSYPGALVVETTTPLDPESLAAGVWLECTAEDPPPPPPWGACAAATFVVAEDDNDPTLLVIMPTAGWQVGQRYRVALLPEASRTSSGAPSSSQRGRPRVW